MSEKIIEIKGQKISESTIVEALKKHCNFQEKKKPIIELVQWSEPNDRLAIRLPNEAIKRIKEGHNIVILTSDGCVVNSGFNFVYADYYDNLHPIFGEI